MYAAEISPGLQETERNSASSADGRPAFHTETDADEIAEPCAFRRSETEHTVSTQTRRRRMNTRNDRICLNPNEYYTKTTI